MGNDNARDPGLHQGKPDTPAGAGDRPHRAAGNPPAPAPRTGNPAPARTADGPRTGKAEEKKVPGLAPVNKTPDPVPVPEAPKKGQKKAPSKKKPKKDPTAYNAEQIAALIQGTSGIVAARPGMEIFVLSQEEATQLATPIANMIAKSEKLNNMGEYADAIALVTASLVIFGPRIMIYNEQQKAKKLANNGGVKLVRKEAEGDAGNRKPARPSTPQPKAHESGILDAIPSTL